MRVGKIQIWFLSSIFNVHGRVFSDSLFVSVIVDCQRHFACLFIYSCFPSLAGYVFSFWYQVRVMCKQPSDSEIFTVVRLFEPDTQSTAADDQADD